MSAQTPEFGETWQDGSGLPVAVVKDSRTKEGIAFIYFDGDRYPLGLPEKPIRRLLDEDCRIAPERLLGEHGLVTANER